MRVKRSFILMGLLHIAILMWILYAIKRPVIEYSYHDFAFIDEDNFEEDAELGFLVDENGTYLLTPLLDLPAGSYYVKLNYEASGEENTWNLYSAFPSVGMSAGNIANPLESGKSEKEISFQTLMPLSDFAIKVNYGHEGKLKILGIEIRETEDFRHVTVFLGTLILLMVDAGLWCWRRKASGLHQKNFWNGLLLLSGIVLLSSIPLFTGYLVKGHDLRFHLTRILGIAQGLQNGEFPVRMQSNWLNEYGYPVSVFYGDLLLYLPALLKNMGFTLETAYIVYVVSINFLTAYLAFFVGYRLGNSRNAAFIAAAFYTLAPYRLVLLYTRAAVGEYTAYAFYPLLFYGLYLILMGNTQKREYKWEWLYLTAGFTMLIQSHVLSTEIAVFFIGIVCLVMIRRVIQPQRLLALGKAAVSTLLVNFFFLLPFLDYMRGSYNFNSTDPETLQMWGLMISQLLMLFPGSRGYATQFRERLTYEGQLPVGIGFAAMIILGMFLWYAVNGEKKNVHFWKMMRFAFAGTAISLFMTTVYFPWDLLVRIPVVGRLLFGSIQYPMRFLGIAFMFMALLTLCMVRIWEQEKRNTACFCALLTVGMLVSSGWYSSSLLQEGEFLSLRNVPVEGLDISNGEYLLSDTNLSELSADIKEIPDGLEVSEWRRTGNQIRFLCSNLSEEISLPMPVFAYKYWRAVNEESGSELETVKGDNNRLEIRVPGKFRGRVRVEWKEPILWRITEMISAVTLLSLTVMLLWNKRKVYQERGNEEG